jgi:hypothetical protein
MVNAMKGIFKKNFRVVFFEILFFLLSFFWFRAFTQTSVWGFMLNEETVIVLSLGQLSLSRVQ